MSLRSISFLVASLTTSATSPLVTVPDKTPSSPTCFLTVNLPIVVRAVWKSIASCLLAASCSACLALLYSTCFKTVGVTGKAFLFGNKKFLAKPGVTSTRSPSLPRLLMSSFRTT